MDRRIATTLFGLVGAAALWLAFALGVGSRPAPAPPTISEWMKTPAVLVFSETRGWRHNDGIAGGDVFFANLTRDRGFGLFTTADSAVFNADDLARFDVIVFNNVSGEALNKRERVAFETWMHNGGAWIGIHGSGDSSERNWPWYSEHLIGATFIGHTTEPQFQAARLVRLAAGHPVVAAMPPEWSHTDEWYSFDRLPDPALFTTPIGLDESSYSPRNYGVDRWPEDLSMSDSPVGHPIVWATCGKPYRGVYSAIGHANTSYEDPNVQTLLTAAFDWVHEGTTDPGAIVPCAPTNDAD